MPVAELLSDNENDETVEKFIDKNIPPHKRTAIITDLKKSYDKIIEKLGFTHQKCTFHLKLNIDEKIKRYLNKINKNMQENTKNSSQMPPSTK